MNPWTIHMIMAVLLALFAQDSVLEAASSGECTDLHDRTIPDSFHYVPGPDACTVCVCDSGAPKWCHAVLCAPPQDCKSFRVGTSCCEFVCLDDMLPVHPTDESGGQRSTDFGLHLVATAVIAVLSLSLLFFLIHRLRQRKIRVRQNRRLQEDQRSLGSVGYITGSLGYLAGSVAYLNGREYLDFLCEEPPAAFPFWKPPETYIHPGEVPPSYEETVAAARAEAASAVAESRESEEQERQNDGIAVIAGADSAGAAVNNNTFGEIIQNMKNEVLSSGDVPAGEESGEAFDEDVQVHRSSPRSAELPAPGTSPELAGSTAAARATSPRGVDLPKLNDLNKGERLFLDENDDYRSECENCKSSQQSSYMDLTEEEEPNVPANETMTLPRHPPSYVQGTANGYCTSLTLPVKGRKLRDHGTLLDADDRQAALQRFSLQLVLDWSDTSSSSMTLSPEHRTISPISSSSETSSDTGNHT